MTHKPGAVAEEAANQRTSDLFAESVPWYNKPFVFF